MESELLPRQLHETRLLHEKYQMNLPAWHQFVIWSYTLGSGTVNASLRGAANPEDLDIWSRRLASTFREVSAKQNYKIPKAYRKFEGFLRGTADLTPAQREELIGVYARNLQLIIKRAPALTGNIIVHKASSPYPGLEVGVVPQKVFNSTSYRADMNYSIFLPPGGLCCLHRILVEKGARILILSPLLSAYPDEAEILFPYNVDFRVTSTSTVKLSVPANAPAVTWKEVQERPLTLGPVFFYNYKNDCNAVKKDIKIFNSVLVSN